jgi:hypothetical protein
MTRKMEAGMSDPRINVYTCQVCGKHSVTVDVDKGVTQSMIGCRAQNGSRRKCIGMAYSSFYPRGPKPAHIGEPQWEWYKPTDEQLKAHYSGGLLEQMREHVAKGGLDLRGRTKAVPIVHVDSAPPAER